MEEYSGCCSGTLIYGEQWSVFARGIHFPRLDVQFDKTIVADNRIDLGALSLLEDLGKVHIVEKTLFPYHFGITGGLVNSNGAVEAMPDPMAPNATAVCIVIRSNDC